MPQWRWLAMVLWIAILLGCTHPEATVITDLVVNGRVISGGARTHGDGYMIPAATLTRELAGTMEVFDKRTTVITLNGKRFLLGAPRTGVPFDHGLQGGVESLGGETQLYQSQLVEIISLAYPGGKVYKEDSKIYLVTPG